MLLPRVHLGLTKLVIQGWLLPAPLNWRLRTVDREWPISADKIDQSSKFPLYHQNIGLFPSNTCVCGVCLCLCKNIFCRVEIIPYT